VGKEFYTMDKIFLRELELETVIGVYPEERARAQKLVLNVELALDLAPAGISDDLAMSTDYHRIAEELKALGRKSRFRLLEKFAEESAKICLADPRVEAVRVNVRKSDCVESMLAAEVEIERKRR